MADFDKPDNLSDYANVWDYVKAVQESLALWQDGTTDENQPTGAKRYSSTNKRFETYNGTSWVPLIALDADQANAYQIRVAKANEADSVGVATNALNLGGTAASQFVQTSDARMSDARQCNNTFGSAAASRVALSVYSQTEMTTALGLKANVESPALTGNPTCPTQAMGNNSTRVASTAFVAAAIAAIPDDPPYPSSTSYGAWVNLTLASTWTSLGVCRVRTVTQDSVVIAYDFEIEAGNMGVQSPTTLIATIPAPYRPTYAKKYYGVGEWLIDGENSYSGLSVITFNTNGSLVANSGGAKIYFRERLWVS